MELLIRNARPEDAGFIARTVLEGVGYAAFDPSAAGLPVELSAGTIPLSSAVDVFTGICGREDTLYSYRRTRVACVGDVPVGALVSYPGEENAALRIFTWRLLNDGYSEGDTEAECEPGEYYLDSLAVHPDFRGQVFDCQGSRGKAGHLLMTDGIRCGQARGFSLTSLIAAEDSPRLQHYYEQLGFRPVRRILFFGHPYVRMVR